VSRHGGCLAASIKSKEDANVKCEVCGKELNNSEELNKHLEQEHPMDELDIKDSENPEIKREMPDSEPADMPEPVEQRR
jgi:hypothetical protein